MDDWLEARTGRPYVIDLVMQRVTSAQRRGTTPLGANIKGPKLSPRGGVCIGQLLTASPRPQKL